MCPDIRSASRRNGRPAAGDP